jgi:hypothetical protein
MPYCTAGACGVACAPGWTLCGTACALLPVDVTNCGTCGTACASGQACSRGSCVSAWLATGLSTAEDVASDGVNVYWTDTGNGSVGSVPVGGGSPTPLATGQQTPRRVAFDSQYVYWSNQLGGAIVRAPKNGQGMPSVASPASTPWGIVVDSTNLYWRNLGDNTIRKWPLAGGTATMLGPSVSPDSNNEIVTDGTALYFLQYLATDTALTRLDKNGTVTNTIGNQYVPQIWAEPFGIVSAYTGLQPGGAVYSPYGTELNDDYATYLSAFIADECAIYWTGAVDMRCTETACVYPPPSPGPPGVYAASLRVPVAVRMSSATSPGRLATDGKAIYWADGTQIGKVALP